jgi:arylsulfatase A-like enzyme
VPRSGRTRPGVAACGGTPPLRPDGGVFAGFLRHADHLAGRLIAFPWRLGELDNTLISAMSGNGAEGSVSEETETEGGHDGDSQEVWYAGIWPGQGAGRGG